MKHVFVVNPHAGRAKAKEIIEHMLQGFKYEHEVYYTTGHKDATRFVRERCENAPDEQLRFYACGGDGTIKEVAEGVYGHDNADLTAVPLGSGNDFVKYYGGADKFTDLNKLAEAESDHIDLIKVNDEFCINVANFGFESYVAKTMDEVRHKKLIGGKNSYTTGIVKALFCAMRNKADIYVDGERINNGEYLLGTVANGRFEGGAFQCAPRSFNNDGELDVCIANVISKLDFVRLVSVYKEGKHLDDPRFEKIVTYRRGKKVEVRCTEENTIALDGELVRTQNFTCEVIPHAVRFAAVGIRAERKEASLA
jgi:diacylglycerol kinase (ATP)